MNTLLLGGAFPKLTALVASSINQYFSASQRVMIMHMLPADVAIHIGVAAVAEDGYRAEMQRNIDAFGGSCPHCRRFGVLFPPLIHLWDNGLVTSMCQRCYRNGRFNTRLSLYGPKWEKYVVDLNGVWIRVRHGDAPLTTPSRASGTCPGITEEI